MPTICYILVCLNQEIQCVGRILGLSDYKYVDIEEIIYLFKVKK